MISLKDEIKRFQNMVYNKQLAEFVTVDQMFVGGGITIESMIRESNFIVDELKKMNAVFINFCRLNEKVYTKIMGHELSTLEEQTKMTALAASVDRKVADTIKNLKELHESTVSENAKSAKMVEIVTESLRKEIEGKVDRVTFEASMKRFLQEYDEGTLGKDYVSQAADEDPNLESITYEKGIQTIEVPLANGSLPAAVVAQGTGSIKKKGKVGYQDFYRLQADLQAKLKESGLKLNQIYVVANQSKQLMTKYLPIINKSATDVSMHTSEIFRLSNESTSHHNQLDSAINKVLNELNHRINDQIWNDKLETFFEKSVRPHLNQIDQQSKTFRAQFKAHRQEYNNKMVNLDGQMTRIKSLIQDIDQRLKKTTKETSSISSQLKTNYEQFSGQKEKANKNMDSMRQETNHRLKELQECFHSQLQQLKSTLQTLVQSVGQSVFKTVNKKVQTQLKTIEGQIRANRDKIKGARHDIQSVSQQIQNMKEILSRKANYSDIIHQVEKKADREDFKGLQVRLNESSQQFVSQQFVSKNLNDSINVSKLEKYQKQRGSSLSRPNKTLFAPTSTPTRINKTEFDISTKLFMCGKEGHLGEAKKEGQLGDVKTAMMSQHTRRRSIKSSAAVASDFT